MALRRGSIKRGTLLALLGLGLLLVILSNLPSFRLALGAIQRGWAHGGLIRELLGLVGRGYALARGALFNPLSVALYGVVIGAVILLENRNPDRTVAWLMALALVPLLGLVAYLLVGPKFASARALRRRHQELARHRRYPLEVEIPPSEFQGVARLLVKTNGAVPLAFQDVTVLSDSASAFGAMFAALEGAKGYLHAQFFSLTSDGTGRRFAQLLMEARRRGVEVRLLYDGVGSWGLERDLLEELKAAGVRAVPFLPISFPMFRREFNYRNHRKILVVDGSVAFVGGFNVGDKYVGLAKGLSPWRDTMLRIRGDGALGLDDVFRRDWRFASGEELPLWNPPPAWGGPFVQVATGGPDSPGDPLKHAYLAAMGACRERLWLTTPYLVPGMEVMEAMRTAAMRGVDVRLVIPGRPDHRTVYFASRHHIGELLEAGVQVYRYQRGFIHAKTMIVDRELAAVGTLNLDVRSLEINYEVQAFIHHRRTVERLEADFVKDFMDSHLVTREEWASRGLWERLLDSSFRLLSPEL
jgi:cardiolipin synthase